MSDSNSIDVHLNEDVQTDVLKQRIINERTELNVRFASKFSFKSEPDYEKKNIFALILILFIPNFIMVMVFTVVHCNSSYLTLVRYISTNTLYDVFTSIWFLGDIHLLFGFSIIIIYMLFALFLMILVPGPIVCGPLTPNGNVPKYKDNGLRCYSLTLLVFVVLTFLLSHYTSYSVSIVYKRLPSLLFCSNIISLAFCLFLFVKGRYFPSSTDEGSSGYFFFDYYWGMELHPRIRGVDLKIFTNCRFGMTVWALMILCYLCHSIESGLLHGGQVVNAVLQLLYITKFFWWEAGYYSTIDIMLDRAGFYLCWGCLSFIPSMFTLSSYYMASVWISTSPWFYLMVLILGLASLVVNYWADYQKQVFRSSGGKCLIWGKRPQMIEASYIDHTGESQNSLLLLSGFWGLARHFHYLPELMLAFSWCAAAGFHHLLPFTYFFFLVILLVHRVERDDSKCVAKYGDHYLRYKELVPWKIVPYIY